MRSPLEGQLKVCLGYTECEERDESGGSPMRVIILPKYNWFRDIDAYSVCIFKNM